jgi:y4mF family transcriptional regulator
MTRIYAMADIGSLVKRKRTELGMTQSQLADICGSGTRFISELENGKPTMQVGKVLDMLHVLGLNIIISERGH